MFAFACLGLLRDPPKLFRLHTHPPRSHCLRGLALLRALNWRAVPARRRWGRTAQRTRTTVPSLALPLFRSMEGSSESHHIRTHGQTGRARSPLHRLFLRSPQASSAPRPEHSWPYSEYMGSGRADNECAELLADIAALQNGTPIYFNALLVGGETFRSSHGLGPVERGTLEALFTTAPTSVIVGVQLTNQDTFAICLIWSRFPSSAARARADTLSALRRAAWRPSSTVRSLRRCRQQCIPVATIPRHPRLARSNDVFGTPALGSGTSSASSGP